MSDFWLWELMRWQVTDIPAQPEIRKLEMKIANLEKAFSTLQQSHS